MRSTTRCSVCDYDLEKEEDDLPWSEPVSGLADCVSPVTGRFYRQHTPVIEEVIREGASV